MVALYQQMVALFDSFWQNFLQHLTPGRSRKQSQCLRYMFYKADIKEAVSVGPSFAFVDNSFYSSILPLLLVFKKT